MHSSLFHDIQLLRMEFPVQRQCSVTWSDLINFDEEEKESWYNVNDNMQEH